MPPKTHNPNDPQEHWLGMPEFKQEDKQAIARVTINFLTEADMAEFNRITGLSVTKRTKGVFFPIPKNKKVKYVNET